MAKRVYPAGDDFLTGAGLSFDQHAAILVGHFTHQIHDLSHFGTVSDDIVRLRALAQRLAQIGVLVGESLLLQGAFDDDKQLLWVERFRQIVERALANRLDCRIDFGKGRHHHRD